MTGPPVYCQKLALHPVWMYSCGIEVKLQYSSFQSVKTKHFLFFNKVLLISLCTNLLQAHLFCCGFLGLPHRVSASGTVSQQPVLTVQTIQHHSYSLFFCLAKCGYHYLRNEYKVGKQLPLYTSRHKDTIQH